MIHSCMKAKLSLKMRKRSTRKSKFLGKDPWEKYTWLNVFPKITSIMS